MKIRFYLYVYYNSFLLNGMAGGGGLSAFSIKRLGENCVYCRTNRLGKLFKNDYEVEVMK